MAKIIVFTNLTLDGVMQAPGRPDEDTREGFKHGGWATPFAAMLEAGDVLANVGAVLFGRWTYESFYDFWPNQPDNPFTTYFNDIPKYVASTTLESPLAWINSTLLKGDIAKTIGKLKEEQDKDFVVFGSGVLIQSLMRYNFVDEYVLLIHPLVLGSGRRLFTDDGASAALRLVNSKTTTTGVLIATYEPADSGGRVAQQGDERDRPSA
jgi:dihydrofolate reductase